MKSQILLFLTLITYILSDVTISSVETGTCTNKEYTFVIKANSNANLTAGTATVTLSSPENTTPTCSYSAVTVGSSGGRRLADGDFDITCKISTKLDGATITVKSVTLGSVTATAATDKTLPISMSGTATCEGTTTTTTTTTTTSTDNGKFIQISGILFLIIFILF